MTASYRLKGLGWFSGVVIVSLSFYLVSLQVAAERKRLAQIDAKISAAEREIRSLETEFDVRANLAQLERWNGNTLALVAPTASQFVKDEAQLAAISFRPGATMPGDSSGAIQTAQLIVPAGAAEFVPVTAPAAPVTVPAAATKAVSVQVAANTAAPRPLATKAPPPVTEPVNEPRLTKAAVVRTADASAGSLRKAHAVAMLDKSLLSDSTLGDLMSGARSERGRLR
ncbi:hypothetical protein ACH0BU_00840 [Sphingomonas olei]